VQTEAEMDPMRICYKNRNKPTTLAAELRRTSLGDRIMTN